MFHIVVYIVTQTNINSYNILHGIKMFKLQPINVPINVGNYNLYLLTNSVVKLLQVNYLNVINTHKYAIEAL